MDFCLLLYISGYSGKTMEEWNVMFKEMEKNSDAVSDSNYSSDSKAQLHLNFQKKNISGIEKYSTVAVRTWGRLLILQVFGTIFQK